MEHNGRKMDTYILQTYNRFGIYKNYETRDTFNS